jgi:ATP-dependent DNA ligase
LERKARLRKLVPQPARAVFYADYVSNGEVLFCVICERDLEGIVAKLANAPYTPDATTWVKIKNRQYSQAGAAATTFSTGASR